MSFSIMFSIVFYLLFTHTDSFYITFCVRQFSNAEIGGVSDTGQSEIKGVKFTKVLGKANSAKRLVIRVYLSI